METEVPRHAAPHHAVQHRDAGLELRIERGVVEAGDVLHGEAGGERLAGHAGGLPPGHLEHVLLERSLEAGELVGECGEDPAVSVACQLAAEMVG